MRQNKNDLEKMSKPSSFSTICTSNCAFELTGLLLSLSVVVDLGVYITIWYSHGCTNLPEAIPTRTQ